MSSKKVSIPEPPKFQTDPNLTWSQDLLKGQADYLIGGLTGSGLSGLMSDTVSFNPEITRLAIEQVQSQLAPSYRTGRQNIINELEANNQLTGSTTASSLANYENDYMSQLTAAGANAAINDINRALNNRVSLYGTGLNTASNVGGTALGNQEQMNQFALQNYENQVAYALSNKSTGNPWGALGGAGVGAAIGTLIAPGVGTAIGAGIGSNLGNAAFGGGSQSGAGISNAFSSLGSFAGSGAGNTAWRSPTTTSSSSETIFNPIYNYSPYGTNSSTLSRWMNY